MRDAAYSSESEGITLRYIDRLEARVSELEKALAEAIDLARLDYLYAGEYDELDRLAKLAEPKA